MKVETKPIEQRPEVVITLSWEEAEVLLAVVGNISGWGQGRDVTSAIYDGITGLAVGLRSATVRFSGSFRDG